MSSHPQPTSHYFRSQRLKLHYAVWGDESKPPLLLIHGNRDHARSWDRTAEAFMDRYCVYAVDLRGHGDSDWAIGGDYSIIDHALDVHALGEEIGRAPYTVIAHSLGGSVALEYAGTFPEKVQKLVSIEGMGGMRWANAPRRPAHVRMRQWIEGMRSLEERRTHLYATVAEAEQRMVEANGHLSPELAHHLTVEGIRGTEGGYAWKFDNYTRAGSPYEFNMEDARDIWNQIRCPILLLFGEESWSVRGGEPDLSVFHNCRSVKVANAGHWLHHDQFEVFMDHTERFLAE